MLKKRILLLFYFLFVFISFFTLKSLVFASPSLPDNIKSEMQDSVILFIGSSNGYINGFPLQIDSSNLGVFPQIVDNRTLVPVRFISEGFNADVSWDQDTQTAIIELGQKNIKIQINSNIIDINGINSSIDVPAQIINDRTFVPLRAIVEALGKNVFWDDRGLIIISNKDKVIDKNANNELITTLVKSFNKYGTSIGNTINSNNLTYDDRWVYFADTYTSIECFRIYKIKRDGTQKTQLYESYDPYMYPSFLNISEGALYFISRNNKLFRLSLDNQDLSCISNDNIRCFIIIGDWIYYYSCDDLEIYKIKLDGSCKTNISNVGFSPCKVIDCVLYYIDEEGHPKTCSLSIINNLLSPNVYNNELISYSNIDFEDDWIYFIDEGIYRMKLDETSKTKLCDDFGDCINVDNGWIYFNNHNDYNTLYKIRIDGTQKAKLNDDYTSNITIMDNLIVYHNHIRPSYFGGDTTKLFRININGSDRSCIDNDIIENSSLNAEDKDNLDKEKMYEERINNDIESTP